MEHISSPIARVMAALFDRTGLPDRLRVRRSVCGLKAGQTLTWDQEALAYRVDGRFLWLLAGRVRLGMSQCFEQAPVRMMQPALF